VEKKGGCSLFYSLASHGVLTLRKVRDEFSFDAVKALFFYSSFCLII